MEGGERFGGAEVILNDAGQLVRLVAPELAGRRKPEFRHVFFHVT